MCWTDFPLSVVTKIILDGKIGPCLPGLLKKVSGATSFSNHYCREKYNYNHVFLVNSGYNIQSMVSQRFMYSLPQELANIVVLKEYLDNIKGVFLCYANIFEPLLSHSTFWFEFNSLGFRKSTKVVNKVLLLYGEAMKMNFNFQEFPFPPCELSYISIVSPK